ncbi:MULTISPECIES: ribosome maturation factor [unclassified Campylobacter]|uniref:ribosome maturation factor n=1 Tax=unclassified Campylobacter TaxID=2593542 RepID=UPI001BDB0AB8|nr:MULTISPECIES: ribosome maturation factor [unclassified Campylobacter]MBZ7983301.1 ribosome maturation factor [Campylobacter sp. RM12647]MBZ7992454.1 ribosome maturation factor [Campylobacter sp. RM9333]MBZ8006553.1 ribosome maturation factor [Campylobacter sp. RM9334]MBT0879898.1 ribosome maturation factor [Campylobacter sp. 2018MI27]MBT0882163.1 ribosome maturation factor [Campylobacter sp. 2018MI13]
MELENLAKQLNLVIYDTELAKEGNNFIYRIFILKDGENKSVSLDDCEQFSRLISPILDLNPPTDEKYFLEVSSPGLERKLTKIEHFKLSIGEILKIKTKEKEEIISKLLSADDEKITLEDGTILNYADIKSTKTYIYW